MGQDRGIAGAALARALTKSAQAPVSVEQGRTLLLALVRLNELAALRAVSAEQLSTVPGPLDRPGAVVRCSDRSPGEVIPGSLPTSTAKAVLGSGTREGLQGTIDCPAYNVGSLIASDEQSS